MEPFENREAWEEKYRAAADPWRFDGSLYDLARTRTLLDRLRYARFKKHLDAGCGEGFFTDQLSKLSDEVHGFDIAEAAVARARERYPRIRFFQADVRDLDAAGARDFDFISCVEMLYYIRDLDARDRALRALADAGRPNCLYYFEIKVKSYGNPRFIPLAEFLEQAGRYFNPIDVFPALAYPAKPLRALLRLPVSMDLRVRALSRLMARMDLDDAHSIGYLAVKR